MNSEKRTGLKTGHYKSVVKNGSKKETAWPGYQKPEHEAPKTKRKEKPRQSRVPTRTGRVDRRVEKRRQAAVLQKLHSHKLAVQLKKKKEQRDKPAATKKSPKEKRKLRRAALRFEGDVFGALDEGVFLEGVVVAVGEVGAVMAAAAFFAGEGGTGH